jgi:hypothetical protein
MTTKPSVARTNFPKIGVGRLKTALRLAGLLLTFPAVVQAQFTFTTNNSSITITGYNGPGGAVAIPSTTNGYPVTGVGDYAFYSLFSLTSIAIPDSVTNIGIYAFYGCTSLTGVAIPNSVTNIGDWAFAESGLTSATIGDSVTSIGDYAFYSLFNLASVTIPASVTSIGSNAFAADGLTSITIPNSVTNIGDLAFNSCISLAAITVSTDNPAYSSVAGVLFNKSETSLIQYPPSMAGTSYTIPNAVTNVAEYAFWDSKLTDVTIPNSVTSLGNFAFGNSWSLASVTIPDSVTNIGSQAFSSCRSLGAITVSPDNSAYSSVAGVLLNKSQTTLLQYPAGQAGDYLIPGSVSNIGEFAFYLCDNLTSVTIPDGVTNIGNYAFEDCYSLSSVAIGTNVASIGEYAFWDCDLTSVTIPNSVTSIGDCAFGACWPLTAITVSTDNPSYCSVSGVLFNRDMTSLLQYPPRNAATSYAIPNTVNNIGDDAFDSCESLTNVTIPSGVTNIGDGAFFYCIHLAGITIPNTVTSIGDSAFSYCSSLRSITIPDSVASIGERAFMLSGLVSVTIPNSITSIGEYAFWDSDLASVTIPGSVASIGNEAFDICASLTSVYCLGNAPTANSTVFAGDTKATAYYLPGTAGWASTFGGIPTAPWFLPTPQILNNGSMGVQSNAFGFTISWATNLSVIIEASTNLANPVWTPLATNPLASGTDYFRDPQWTNFPNRYYRVKSP